MTTSDKISIGGTLVGFFGFLAVIWQIGITNEQVRKSESTQRAQFLTSLHQRAFENEDYLQLFTKLEYGEIVFNDDFHGSSDQAHLIALLNLFELVAIFEKAGRIEYEDIMEVFGYQIVRIFDNAEVKKYREWIKGYAERKNVPMNFTFPNFDSLAVQLKDDFNLNPPN